LDEFISRRPQTDIQVRVKPLSGEYGILESLRTTRAAASIIAPELIVLPRPLMEEAVREGLILPLDELTNIMEQEDWYPYAQELSRVDGELNGIPFAGDLLILAYKSDTEEAPPSDWEALLESGKALTFPASDPMSVVTLAQYRNLGQDLETDTGEVNLQREPLLEVLTFYQSAQVANVMPYWLTQFETDEQAWQSYQERQATLAITWSSTMLGFESSNTALAAMPTKEGKAFALADGWVWCLIPSNPGTEEAALELIEYLTVDSYLSTWSIAAGYLPVRPSGLEDWSEEIYYSTLGQLLPSAVMLPSRETLSEVGPLVREAVVSVLKDQANPSAVLNELLPTKQESE
jgi:ABC-type glycerol-3-phosphate transport system substrate-binding protein